MHSPHNCYPMSPRLVRYTREVLQSHENSFAMSASLTRPEDKPCLLPYNYPSGSWSMHFCRRYSDTNFTCSTKDSRGQCVLGKFSFYMSGFLQGRGDSRTLCLPTKYWCIRPDVSEWDSDKTRDLASSRFLLLSDEYSERNMDWFQIVDKHWANNDSRSDFTKEKQMATVQD